MDYNAVAHPASQYTPRQNPTTPVRFVAMPCEASSKTEQQNQMLVHNHHFTCVRSQLIAFVCIQTLANWSQAVEPLSKQGTLILCGGGKPYNEQVLDTFWEHAGGANANIVIIPTAHPEMDSPDLVPIRIQLLSEPWTRRGVRSVTVCHTMNREEAETEGFAHSLDSATGVWIGGGDQRRLCEIYCGTRFHQALLDLFHRGGTIGGSSAGTAIQSELTILGEADGKTILVPGFGLLPDAVVDQHFLARNRIERLSRAVEVNPDMIGIGVDEYTAAVIQGHDISVVGKSTVSILRPTKIPGKTQLETLRPGSRVKI